MEQSSSLFKYNFTLSLVGNKGELVTRNHPGTFIFLSPRFILLDICKHVSTGSTLVKSFLGSFFVSQSRTSPVPVLVPLK